MNILTTFSMFSASDSPQCNSVQWIIVGFGLSHTNHVALDFKVLVYNECTTKISHWLNGWEE